MALIYVLYLLAIRKPKVKLTEENILYPSLIYRKIRWDELSGILLKDDILTIDLKNNQLIQHQIDQSFLKINQQEFNDFCKKQLASAASGQPNKQ